jgi:hypothetical protein
MTGAHVAQKGAKKAAIVALPGPPWNYSFQGISLIKVTIARLMVGKSERARMPRMAAAMRISNVLY